MRLQLPFSFLLVFLFVHNTQAAIENLDEIEARKPRRATNVFYSGETAGNNWTSQPESLIYSDVTTGKEVAVLTSTPNKSNIFYTDISPANPWSADGARLGFFSNRNVSAFTRYAGSSLDGALASAFVMRSDGSFIRPTIENSSRTWGSTGSSYFIWSPVLRDTFYAFGETYNGLTLNKHILYKNTVSDNSGSYQPLVTFPTLSGADNRYEIKKIISANGLATVATNNGNYFPVWLTGTPGLFDADGWAEYRGQGTLWGGGNPFPSKHDIYMPHSDKVFILFSYETSDPNSGPVVYKYDLRGSDADGGPHFNSSNIRYSTWNDEEAEPMMAWNINKTAHPESNYVPFDTDGGAMHGWGHPGFDRWGRIVIFNDGNGYHSPNCLQEWGGPVAWDYVNRVYPFQESNPQSQTCPQALINNGLDYVDWNGWSDYFAYADINGTIQVGKYNALSAAREWFQAANLHGNQNSSTSYWWTSTHRPAQSPDGTKIATGLNFLTNVSNTGDIGFVVAYYPHPPEITSVTNNSGTYTIRFDWRTDQTKSRGYTQRGWPNEMTDAPPPPRETKQFRLWRSADQSTWVPLDTIEAEIFERYNFASGQWIGKSYWEFTDHPGEGTYFYAVTSQEWSGLESRTLSNVFSTAGAQTAAYPSDPKGINPFYRQPPPSPLITVSKLSTPGQYKINWQAVGNSLIRYYNIYYSNSGSSPKIQQQNRIASLPAQTTEYVDWLADKNNEAKYLVTSVDSQGNESGIPSITLIRSRPLN